MANRVFEVYSKWPPKVNFCHIYKSFQPILLIFGGKHRITIFYLFCNVENNRSIISSVRVLSLKKIKMAAITSSVLKFRNRRWANLANICKIIFGKFHQNRPIHLGCEDDTDRLTDRHTDRQTHIQTHRHPGSIATFILPAQCIKLATVLFATKVIAW